ncbi:MAG: LuxR C-terminal-related transcriptional regulator [Acidimicrobiia bacterium]
MFLERESELARLMGVLDDLDREGGRVVLIRGEAGIGKSALLREFVERAANRARVYFGYCDALITPNPFAPLWDIARNAVGLEEALLDSDRQRVLSEFFALTQIGTRPTLIAIEDTHWSDEATLDAVKHLGRRIFQTRAILLLTYRVGEVDFDHPLRTVIGDLPPSSVVRIDLEGLSRDGVYELVAESGLDADRVYDLTSGNPFLTTEMAVTGGDDVPPSVRDSALARLSRLSPTARQLLNLLCLIPERLPVELFGELSEPAHEELAEFERLALLQFDDGFITFRHELLRRAVEATLTISEKTALHRRLLDQLEGRVPPARIVHHAREAGDRERILAYAPAAASAAAELGAHREASAHYHLLEPYLISMPAAEQATILTDWARIEYYLANVGAVDILERAISIYRELDRPRQLASTLALAIAVNETHARTRAAEEYALEAIRVLEPEGPSADLAAALSRYADLLLHQGEGRKADEVVDRAISMAATTGDEAAEIRALIVKSMLAFVRGDPGGRELVETTRSRAESGGFRYEEVTALRSLAYTSQEQDNLDLALDVSQRARAAAIRYELPFLEAEANAVYADSLMRRGRWDDAEVMAAESLGSHANADVHLHRVLGLLHMRRGRLSAGHHLEAAWTIAATSDEIDYLLHVGSALAEKMWVTSTPEEPLIGVLDDLVARGLRQEFPWLAGALAFWLSMCGAGGPPPTGVPEPYRLAIAGDLTAIEHWESKKMPYESAVVRSLGDKTQRLEALASLEALGANAVAARLRQEFRAEGVRVPRGPGMATRSHAAGLTARQAEVLDLLAEDLTNLEIADRLFISPRTVENHVSAILGKLGVEDREQAVAAALATGLMTSQI